MSKALRAGSCTLVTSRFVSNLIVMIAGMTLVAFSLVFRSAVLGWLAFGLAALTVTTVLAAFPVRGRGVAQRIVDVLTACAGAWLIVASRSFSGVPLKWICFGSAGLLALFALIGLVIHEVSMELWVRPVARAATDGRADGRAPANRARAGAGAPELSR